MKQKIMNSAIYKKQFESLIKYYIMGSARETFLINQLPCTLVHGNEENCINHRVSQCFNKSFTVLMCPIFKISYTVKTPFNT